MRLHSGSAWRTHAQLSWQNVCRAAVVNGTHGFGSALAAASGFNSAERRAAARAARLRLAHIVGCTGFHSPQRRALTPRPAEPPVEPAHPMLDLRPQSMTPETRIAGVRVDDRLGPWLPGLVRSSGPTASPIRLRARCRTRGRRARSGAGPPILEPRRGATRATACSGPSAPGARCRTRGRRARSGAGRGRAPVAAKNGAVAEPWHGAMPSQSGPESRDSDFPRFAGERGSILVTADRTGSRRAGVGPTLGAVARRPGVVLSAVMKEGAVARRGARGGRGACARVEGDSLRARF